MTRYFVTAWCDRPYYARCEVEAETPQEALAVARDAIDDEPAEQCNEEYRWDCWRVDTADAEGVLLHLDEDAALREAAADLLRGCRMVVERWERGDLAEAARSCRRAIEQAAGCGTADGWLRTPPPERKLLEALMSILPYAELGAEHLDSVADSKNTELAASRAWHLIEQARVAIASAAERAAPIMSTNSTTGGDNS